MLGITSRSALLADTLGVDATRTAGGSTQMHSWSFGSGVKVSVKGGKATIKGSLGRYGKVDATQNAGGAKKGTLPKGCTGTAGTTRTGRVAGKTALALDTTFFKTQKPKALEGRILVGGDLTCGATKPVLRRRGGRRDHGLGHRLGRRRDQALHGRGGRDRDAVQQQRASA